MKVQWYMDPPAIEWVEAMAHIGGYAPGRFIERLVKYHAGELEPGQHQHFEELLEVGSNVVSIDFEPEDPEGD